MRFVVLALGALFAVACQKSYEELRSDGYQCIRKGAGGYDVPKGKEHCFVCDDAASMTKCTQNPLTSTCREAKQTDCLPAPR